MKNFPLRKWFQNLTDRQKDVLLGLMIVLAIAVIYYFQWAFYLTSIEGSKVNIDSPQRYFWWANDSGTYRSAGEWLFGREKNSFIASRPWLYPLILGLSKTLFGAHAERVSWILQFLMWLASGAYIYMSLKNSTNSIVWSMIGSMLFFSHPTSLVLTFHGMTESLNILLVTILCLVLTKNFENKLLYGILILGLLTVTKPIYQFPLGLLTLYFFVRDIRFPALKRIGLIALVLTPIWIQLLLTFINTGRPAISSIGSYTFKNYFVAIVYSRENNMEWRDSMKAIETWDTKEQLNYLLHHRRLTLLTYRNNLIDSDFWTGSIFALGEGNRMIEFSQSFGAAWTFVNLLMIPIMFYYLLSPKYKDKKVITLLYAGLLIQTLLTGISRGQGDRLMINMMPLWIVIYGTVIYKIYAEKTE